MQKSKLDLKKLLRLENITFIAALAGLALGLFAPAVASHVGFLGDLFLTLLKMVILPLILVSVFLAVSKQSGKGELSSIGLKTLFYFLSSSALACVVGMVAANLLPETSQAVTGYVGYDASKINSISFDQVLLSFFTSNPFKSLANGDIIQIVIFAIITGIACTKLLPKKRDLLIEISEAAHDLVMIVIRWILVLAPVGIFSLVASVVAKTDPSKLAGLGSLFIAITVAALFHCLITLPTYGYFMGKFHPYKFMYNVKEIFVVALATASSSATIPVSARVLEEKEGVNPKTTGFVLPLGATLNMDGSALYQVLVVLFLGGIAGIHFSFSQQLLIFVFVMMSSAGTAGIPGGGLVMMGAMLQMLGIPLELIGIYLLVDRFWDPPITAINVMSDVFGAKIIDRFVVGAQKAEAAGALDTGDAIPSEA